jgi:hypothetical protein
MIYFIVLIFWTVGPRIIRVGEVEHNLFLCLNLVDRWTKNNLGEGG